MEMKRTTDIGAVVVSVREDHDGLMWFATANGPVSFDGHEVKPLRAGAEVFLSRVGAITVARDGRIWFGRTIGGVVLYDKRDLSFRSFRHDPDNPDSLSSERLQWAPQLIAEAANGDMWVGTTHGLNRLNPKTGVTTRYFHQENIPDSLVGNEIWCTFVDRDDRLWAGTTQGLSRLDPGSSKFINYRNDPGNPKSLPDNYVYAVTQASDDSIWVGTQSGGLSRFDPDTGEFKTHINEKNNPSSLANNEVFSITPTRDRRLLIGRTFAITKGVEIFNIGSDTFTRDSRNKNHLAPKDNAAIMSAFEDSCGIIWLPYNSGPVYQLRPAPVVQLMQIVTDVVQPTHPNPVLVFAQDATQRVLAGGVGGLSEVNLSTGTYFHRPLWHAPHSSNDLDEEINIMEINSILPIAGNLLWLGLVNTDFLLVDTKNWTVLKHLHHPGEAELGAWSATRDPKKEHVIWFSSQTSGLGQVNTNDNTYKFFNNKSNPEAGIDASFISSITPTDDGQLWLATHGQGLLKFNGEKVTEIHTLRKNDNASLGSPIVNMIVKGKGNTWWIATMQGGLNLLDDNDDTIVRIRKKSGLEEDTIYSMQAGNGDDLWLATLDRVYRFNSSTRKVVDTFNAGGVLPNKTILSWASSMFRTAQNNILIGSLSGLASLTPDNGIARIKTPRILINRLSHDGRPLDDIGAPEQASAITLRWPIDSFEFKLSVLGDNRNLDQHLRYRLLGYGDSWYNTQAPGSGRYTNLPGGSYHLQLQAAFGSNDWGPVKNLQVDVVPPFWRTTWFLILSLLSLLLLVIAAFHYRQFLVRQRMALLEDAVTDRTRDLRAAKRRAEHAESRLKMKADELSTLNEDLEARVAQRTSELNEANLRLTYENEHDNLTNLYNRRIFHNRLSVLWEQSRKSDVSFAMIYIDIDNFKTYNEGYGNATGDILLIGYARRIEQTLGPLAEVFRYGGDQFAALLHGVSSLDETHSKASYLINILTQPIDLNGRQHTINCSIGVAYSSIENLLSAKGMFVEADTAMLRVKRRGGGGIGLPEIGDSTAAERRRNIEILLNEALTNPNEDNRIVAYYQSIVDAQTLQIIGFESLARWYVNDKPYISTLEFIDIAIKTSRAHLLDLAMLQEVSRAFRKYQSTPVVMGLRFIDVNIYGTSFRRSNFLPRIIELTEYIRNAGYSINIELTEQAPAEDIVYAANLLANCRQDGFLISVDDFGTGNSSLTHLLTIKPDILKIDASFVRGIGVSSDYENMIRSTIALAKSLGILLIAEGVETIEQVYYLRDQGCDYLQGYLFDKPGPEESFFLREQST